MRLYQFESGYQNHYVVAHDYAHAEALIRAKYNYSPKQIRDLGPYVILPEPADPEEGA